MATPACCCIFSNNVRHLILLLVTFSITMLFSNIVLFGLTTVLHDEGSLSAGLRTVDSTTSLHPSRKRVIRELNGTDTLIKSITNETASPSQAHPVVSHVIPDASTEPPREMFTTTFLTIPKTSSTTSTQSSIKPRSTVLQVRSTHPTAAEPDVTKYKTNDKDLAEEPDFIGKAADGRLKLEEDQGDEETIKFDVTQFLLRTSIYSIPGVGVLLGTIPITYLMHKIGSRTVFTVAMCISAVATALIPFLISYGFVPLLLMRLLQGLALSAALPLAGMITANWGTLKEQLTFVAFVFLFVPFAPVFSWNLTMLFYSNTLDSQLGVKYAYLTHSAITAFLALSFVLFYREKPQYHPWVNGIELNRIVAGKVQELKNNRINESPLSAVLRSVSAWSIWIAMIGFFFVITVFVTFLPTFFANMDVWMVDSIGLYGSLPFLGMPLFYMLSGLSNRSICCRSTTQVRIWNSIAYGVTAILLVVLPLFFSIAEEGIGRNIMLFMCLAPLGLVVSGALRSVTLVGRFYAQHILSYMGVALGISMTLAPILVLLIIRSNELAEWLRVFILSAAFLAVTAVSFALFGRGRSAGWAEHSWDPSQNKKMLTLEPIQVNSEECGIIELQNIKYPNKIY